MGAGKGYLCKDILEYVKDNFPEFYKKLEYIILERSLEMIKKQRNIVDKNKVKWMKDCPQIKGCFVSNEFFDSMPVHVVEMQEKLKEVYVAYKGKFFEVLKKPSRKELEEYLEKTGINLKKGRRIEVNLQAVEWMNKIARCLHKGFVITIDYGYLSSEVESWPRGTLLCYFKHRVNEEPFKRIGMQDITSHVNFSALMKYGKEHGLEITGYTDQTHFLMALLENYVERLNSNYLDRMLQIKNLILPEGMGGVFKVLIQHKGIENPVLSGLKYEKGFAVS
jgi:SAM-dependent MidA family methyltransferase